MDLTDDVIRAARDSAVDHAGTPAPRTVVQGLLSLSRGDLPDHALVERRVGDRGAAWRVLWLVGEMLVFVRAETAAPGDDAGADAGDDSEGEPGDDPGDDAGDEEQVLTGYAGWARPVTEVASIDLAEVTELPMHAAWEWNAAVRVVFGSGETLPVPLFEGLPTGGAALAVDKVLDALHGLLAVSD